MYFDVMTLVLLLETFLFHLSYLLDSSSSNSLSLPHNLSPSLFFFIHPRIFFNMLPT